jgi:hypothetical protein
METPTYAQSQSQSQWSAALHIPVNAAQPVSERAGIFRPRKIFKINGL